MTELTQLWPLLTAGSGSTVVGVVVGIILHRRFVAQAIADADDAQDRAIESYQGLLDGLSAEFASHRERAAVERARQDERIDQLATQLERCRAESLETAKALALHEYRLARLDTRPTGGD